MKREKKNICTCSHYHFPEKYRNESRNLHLKVIEHNNNLRASIKAVISHASRDVFSCSPDNYVFGEEKSKDIQLCELMFNSMNCVVQN